MRFLIYGTFSALNFDGLFYILAKQIEFWTSGTKLLDGKNWIWLSILKVVDYFNWLPGEPNNKSEFCIDLVVKNKKLLYKDENCDRRIAFICERNSSQEQEHDRGHHLSKY